MSYAADILALSPVAFWLDPGSDPGSGAATLEDQTANNLDLARASGSDIVLGAGQQVIGGRTTSIRSTEKSSAGVVFSRAVTDGSLLDVDSDMTLAFWVAVTAFPASGFRHLAGRQNQYEGRITPTSTRTQALAKVAGTNAVISMPGSTFFPGLNVPVFYAVTRLRDSQEVFLHINGICIGHNLSPAGAITWENTPFTIGGTGGNVAGADIDGVFVLSRALGASEQQDLAAEWSPITTTQVAGLEIPNADGAHSNAPSGGKIADAKMSDSRGNPFRPDQFAAARRHRPLAAAASGDSPATKIPDYAANLLYRRIDSVWQRFGSWDSAYRDPATGIFHYAGTSGSFQRTANQIVSAMAVLHRYAGLAPGRSSEMLERAVSVADFVISTQQADGTYAISTAALSPPSGETPIGSLDFILNDLAFAVLLLRDDLPADKLETYTASIVAAALRLTKRSNHPLAATYPSLNTDGEGNYYINGNRNLQIALCFASVHRLTGDDFWRDEYERALTVTLDPAGAGYTVYHGLPNPYTIADLGLKLGVAPAEADGSDGEGWLTEYDASDTAGDYAKQYLDWGYLNLQAKFALRIAHLYPEDVEPRRLVNLFLNKLLNSTYLNTTTWVFTPGVAGSRTGVVPYELHDACIPYLKWRSHRADLGSFDEAAQYNDLRAQYLAFDNANEVYWRWCSDELAEWIMAGPGVAERLLDL